jgi:glycosyltransferase involved in cell wall biosynthesis
MEVMRAAVAPLSDGRAVVHLTGLENAQLAAVMAGASAFCLPSLMEGFGLTALEAMACGTPVVVSDRGALPEVVGDAGIVVPPNAVAITEALATVLSDDQLAGRLGAAARTRSLDFTWRATADHWRDAIRDAAT